MLILTLGQLELFTDCSHAPNATDLFCLKKSVHQTLKNSTHLFGCYGIKVLKKKRNGVVTILFFLTLIVQQTQCDYPSHFWDDS